MIKLNRLPITPENYAYIGARLGMNIDLRKDILSMERKGYTNDTIILIISGKCDKMFNEIHKKGSPYRFLRFCLRFGHDLPARRVFLQWKIARSQTRINAAYI